MAMKILSSMTVVAFLTVLAGCKNDSQERTEPEPLAAQIVTPDSLETDFLTAPFQGPLGEYKKIGSNIGAQYNAGSGTGLSSLRFYRVETTATGVTRHNVANLAQRTVEIQILDGGLLWLETYTGAQHIGEVEDFYIQSPTDFKISLDYPVGSGGYYIVGEEDDRPAVQEMFTATHISFKASTPRKVRISYTPDPVDKKKGIIKISGQNTEVGVAKSSCMPNVSGVPDRGWGHSYGKPCPNNG
jgi:hypothetical protein